MSVTLLPIEPVVLVKVKTIVPVIMFPFKVPWKVTAGKLPVVKDMLDAVPLTFTV